MKLHPQDIVDRIDSASGLDRVAEPVQRKVSSVLGDGPVRDALQGRWLGHPLHPLLTDLPIGFWTSAWVLDIVGGRKGRPAADQLIGHIPILDLHLQVLSVESILLVEH